MNRQKSIFDWQPWMTALLVASGLITVAAYVGPRPAYAGAPKK